jgi:hypothetical protein
MRAGRGKPCLRPLDFLKENGIYQVFKKQLKLFKNCITPS